MDLPNPDEMIRQAYVNVTGNPPPNVQKRNVRTEPQTHRVLQLTTPMKKFGEVMLIAGCTYMISSIVWSCCAMKFPLPLLFFGNFGALLLGSAIPVLHFAKKDEFIYKSTPFYTKQYVGLIVAAISLGAATYFYPVSWLLIPTQALVGGFGGYLVAKMYFD